jgi:hypothetical protein
MKSNVHDGRQQHMRKDKQVQTEIAASKTLTVTSTAHVLALH